MKSQVMKKFLAPEYYALWQVTRQKSLDSRLDNILRDHVRQAKRQGRKGNAMRFREENITDPLLQKLYELGNTGQWSTVALERLAREIYQAKAPDNVDLGKWISVELECVFVNDKAINSFVSFVRKEKLIKFVTLKDDGSIKTENEKADCDCEDVEDNGHECGFNPIGKEIVITFKDGDWAFVQKICGELRKLKTRVNKSCGLHVHFDCRHLERRQVTTIGKRLALTVNALKQILPVSRRNNRFCSESINSHEPDGGNSRYSFVNLQSYSRHKTLEVRGHSGTIDATKIINWIRICQLVMTQPNNKAVNTVSELITKFEMPSDLVQYIHKRFDKFNPADAHNQAMPEDDVVQDHQVYLDMETSGVDMVLSDVVSAIETRLAENQASRTSAPRMASNGGMFIDGAMLNYRVSRNDGIRIDDIQSASRDAARRLGNMVEVTFDDAVERYAGNDEDDSEGYGDDSDEL